MILRATHYDSENLLYSRYNTETKVMRIVFQSGYLYFFYDVSLNAYKAVVSQAPKGGKAFVSRIKWAYAYRRINRGGSIEDTYEV